MAMFLVGVAATLGASLLVFMLLIWQAPELSEPAQIGQPKLPVRRRSRLKRIQSKRVAEPAVAARRSRLRHA